MEEEEELASGLVNPGDDYTETKYLLYGLDLEEQQYVLGGLSLVLGTNFMQGANCGLHSRRRLQNLHPLQSLNFESPSVAVWSSFANFRYITNLRPPPLLPGPPLLRWTLMPFKMPHSISHLRCLLKS